MLQKKKKKGKNADGVNNFTYPSNSIAIEKLQFPVSTLALFSAPKNFSEFHHEGNFEG